MTWVSRFNLMSVEAVNCNKFDFKHDGLIVMPSGQTLASNGIMMIIVGKMPVKETKGGLTSPVKIKPDLVKVMMKEARPCIRLDESMGEKVAWELESLAQVKGARPFCQVDLDLIETAVKVIGKMTKGNKQLGQMGLTIGADRLELTAWIEETQQGVIVQVKDFAGGSLKIWLDVWRIK